MVSAPDFSLTLITAAAAREDEIVHRPLFEGASHDVPVAALLEDGEPLPADRLDALGIEVDEAFAEAFEELGAHEASWVEHTIPVKGGAALRIAVRVGGETPAVDLLLVDELKEAAALLGAKELAIAIPSSALLLVTDASQKWQLVAAFAAAARMYYAEAGDDALWPGVLRAENGRITGVIDLRTASLDVASKRPAG